MSQTILIESNRQIAYEKEMEDLMNQSIVDTGIRDLSTDRWKTSIGSGLQLDVGDKIALQSVMLNTNGDPDQSIEFVGKEGMTNTYDNQCSMDLSYYLSNNYVNNANLPYLGQTVNKGNPRASDYGCVEVDTYERFQLAFPYRSI